MNMDIKKVKISVTAPSENIEELRNAICKEGAGMIGNIREVHPYEEPAINIIPLIDEEEL